MNYIKSIIVLLIMFFLYAYYGDAIIKFTKLRKNTFSMKIIFGFIWVYFLGTILGLICRFIGTSWQFFAILFSILLLGCCFLEFFFYKKKNLVYLNKNICENLIKNIKNYWFIYAIVILFSVLSFINMQPYILNNYSDDYYIAHIGHLVGANHIFNISYDGVLYQFSNSINMAKEQGNFYRFFNMYELIYSYYSGVFNINSAFCCRFLMTIHNYIIVFFTFHMFTSIFVKEEYSQYSLFPMLVFIIPQGYISKGELPVKIRMFENWRMQTAIYMGGSMVRLLSLPLIIFLFYLLFKEKNKFKLILILFMTYIVLISFQTSAISYIIITTILLVSALMIFSVLNLENKNKYILLILLIISTVIIFYLLEKILNISFLKLIPKGVSALVQYNKYYNDSFKFDFNAKYALIPMAISYLLVNKNISKTFVIVCMLLLIFFRIDKTLCVIVGYFFYGAARMLTSMLILSSTFWGISLINIVLICYEKYENKIFKMLPLIISTCMLLTTIVTLNKKQTIFSKYTADGDGFIPQGYSLTPLLSNDKMIPESFLEIGDFIDHLPKKYYSVAIEKTVNINNTEYKNALVNLLLSSNKIIRYKYDDNVKISNKKVWWLTYEWYSKGQITYRQFIEGTKAYHYDYFLTSRKEVVNKLKQQGYKIVFKSKKYNLWLIKNLTKE